MGGIVFAQKAANGAGSGGEKNLLDPRSSRTRIGAGFAEPNSDLGREPRLELGSQNPDHVWVANPDSDLGSWNLDSDLSRESES